MSLEGGVPRGLFATARRGLGALVTVKWRFLLTLLSMPRRGASPPAEVVGSGPPLLLVPGLGGRAEFWDPVVPPLAARFTVILHDHRGTGRSSIERIDYSIAQMTGDVIALLDHLGFDRAHLIGHSTGGAIGQTLAIDFPQRLDRLVLSATWAAAS